MTRSAHWSSAAAAWPGIAWTAGLLAGLAGQGVRLDDADLVVGTSAGSVVGAWLATGRAAGGHARAAGRPGPADARAAAEVDLDDAGASASPPPSGAGRRRRGRAAAIGAMALETATVPEQARREVMAARLPVHDWPAGLVVTVVDALTGERSALDASCGFPLVDVVAASCAVPGVWPPVTLGDRRYVDGGVHTALNADLAAGAERVLVLAPLGVVGDGPLGAGWDSARPLLGPARTLVARAGRDPPGPRSAATRSTPRPGGPPRAAGLAQAAASLDARERRSGD